MPSSLSDEELIRETLDGNDEAFEELVRRHKTYVMRVVYRYARDEHEVDDLAQQAFLKAYFSLKSYRAKAPFQHWLSRIATHVALDHLRWRHRKKEDFFSEMTDENTELLETILTDASEEKLEDDQTKREARELLEKVLAKLTSQDEWLMRAVELDNKTIKEISEMTGWSISAVKVRLFRARKKMRKVLEKLLTNVAGPVPPHPH
ncbi:MAG: RNA polymerase sigma factor [Chlamydiae bacterium]|nr:RNA polymerase sigma factor [Chlamydiota bacterium]MBI3267327.1 RNA polymerase sigma factor [Chlamydiota bacterium]